MDGNVIFFVSDVGKFSVRFYRGKCVVNVCLVKLFCEKIYVEKLSVP